MNANISNLTNKQVLFREVKDYVMIALGMILYGIGWTIFLLPNDITTGGVPGIASIVFFATKLPVQYTYFAINAFLLLLALKILGFKFCVKTIYAVFVLTFFLSALQGLVGEVHILQDQPFMACVLGASFCGSGIGIAFSANGSSGGTDIIAAIINKYRDVSLGRVVMACDMIIITSSYFVLQDWEKVVYGYVTLYVCSFVLDQIVNSAHQSVQFFIISKHYKEIGEHINKDMHRGVTVLDGTGLYTGNGVKMMFVLAKKRESTAIFRLIKDIDYLRASASLPFFSKIVEIDGKKLLDGGITDSIPLKAFENMGFEQNIVIETRPEGYRKSPAHNGLLAQMVYHKYPAFVKALKRRHIMYNQELDYIKSAEAEKRILVLRPSRKIKIGKMEQNLEIVKQMYNLGRQDALAKLEEIKAFWR